MGWFGLQTVATFAHIDLDALARFSHDLPMGIYYRQVASNIVVFGQTFMVKDQIKTLGGTFNYTDKTWLIPFSDDALQRVIALCGKAGAVSEKSVDSLEAKEGRSDGMSVRDLLMRASQAIQREFPNHVWILGEIENITPRNGHLFFNLAEQKDQRDTSTLTVKAALWSSTLEYLKSKYGPDKVAQVFVDGTKVRCCCRVEFFKDRGQLSLVVEEIDPEYTKGALALAREKLLKKLRAAGLDQKNKLVPRPLFPFRVGLISAPGSRAYSDFVDQLHSNGFPGEVIFAAAMMQGDKVQASVKDALAKLAAADCDLVVLTRGGGSAADLRWFDDEAIALSIAHFSAPVIVAVGHHDDVCVAEEVCHLRQKTPTAAADFVLECFREAKSKIQSATLQLTTKLTQNVERRERDLAMTFQALPRLASQMLVLHQERLMRNANLLSSKLVEGLALRDRGLEWKAQEIQRLAIKYIGQASENCSELLQQLIAVDPKPWVEKGWTQLQIGGKKLRSVADTSVGSEVLARLKDGRLYLKIENKESLDG